MDSIASMSKTLVNTTPFSQLKKICWESDLNKHSDELGESLFSHGYKENLLTDQFIQTEEVTRKTSCPESQKEQINQEFP